MASARNPSRGECGLGPVEIEDSRNGLAVILMSVVKHDGRARSFRGSGDSKMVCAVQEAEASRRRLISL
jgi:hypothetical protein